MLCRSSMTKDDRTIITEFLASILPDKSCFLKSKLRHRLLGTKRRKENQSTMNQQMPIQQKNESHSTRFSKMRPTPHGFLKTDYAFHLLRSPRLESYSADKKRGEEDYTFQAILIKKIYGQLSLQNISAGKYYESFCFLRRKSLFEKSRTFGIFPALRLDKIHNNRWSQSVEANCHGHGNILSQAKAR